jgi:sulfatase maturation enzyme AslB (radical SAM superfamily)
MKHNQRILCTIPWKALFLDERDGCLSALPCCASWINRSYGVVEEGVSLLELWNGPGAIEIRRLIAEGKQNEICAADCPWLFSGRFAEDVVGIIPGPLEFEENQRLNNQEISERNTILKSLPMAVRVIPTLQCNLKCRMCYQDHQAEIHLPETFLTDVHKLGKYIYEYSLHGGEVFISKQFSQWADPKWFAENPQMLLSVITNATKIPKQTWDVLECLRVNHITISLNAAKRETYQYITGSDLFDEVLRNVIALRELSHLHTLRKYQVFLSFVIMRSNYQELPAFANLANQLELPFKLLLVTGDRNGESIYTHPSIIKDILNNLDEAQKIASEKSHPEINQVRESLLASLTSRAIRRNQ